MAENTGYNTKIKVFLGAFINQTNAQNLNCKALAEYLDKTKFQVYTLTVAHGDLGSILIDGVKTFKCRHPVKIFKFIGYMWGIMNSDVAYLPRGDHFKMQRLLIRVFRRKSFKTVENIIDEESLTTALSVLRTPERTIQNFSFTTRVYSITGFMKEYNYSKIGLVTENVILPPPIDTTSFSSVKTKKIVLKSVLFLGNAMKRKRAVDFIQLAKTFPQLTFHIVGKGSEQYLFDELVINDIDNLIYHGLLSHHQLKVLIKGIELHVLPSRSEGFPKGIIECAAAGIPSLVYGDYGAKDWIKSGEDGFVCNNVSDMKDVVHSLLADPDLLKAVSVGALELANRFSIDKVATMYEKEIVSIYNG